VKTLCLNRRAGLLGFRPLLYIFMVSMLSLTAAASIGLATGRVRPTGGQGTGRSTFETEVEWTIADYLGINPMQVSPGRSLTEDLGADEIDLATLEQVLAEKFGVDISARDLARMTVGEIINRIMGRAFCPVS
jgi:acyl carrier protein